LTVDKAARLLAAHASPGANRYRPYVTETATGRVLVADIGILGSSLRGALATKQSKPEWDDMDCFASLAMTVM
jgi:hypothetical protein